MHPILAIQWFFKVLFQGDPSAAGNAAAATPAPVFKASPTPAIQVLGLLQKEGRLLDFLQEDIASYGDAEIGAAVRDIHDGCRRFLKERVKLEPVLQAAEGSPFTVPANFDASAISLMGNVSGKPPYKGTVRHRGWRVAEINLPTVPEKADAHVAAPAEVEV